MAEEILEDVYTGDPVPPAPKLKDEHRSRLDSIVQKMIANKESDNSINAVVNDFKQKYGNVENQKQPAFQVQLSAPTFKQKQESTELRPGTVNEPIRIKKEEIAYAPDERTVEMNKLRGKAQEAQKKIHSELLSNGLTYETKVRESRRDNYTIDQLRDAYKEAGQILSPQDEKRALEREKQRQYEMPVTPEDISDVQTGTVLSDNFSRKFLKGLNNKDAAANSYIVDKYNELHNDPNSLYRIPKVKGVEKEIKAGRVFYDPESRIAYRPVGLVGSLMEGVKNKFKLEERHDFFKNTENDAAIISELEDERNNPDTDTPLNVPKGKLNEFVKTISEMPMLPMVAGAAGTIGGTFIGNPELGPLAATALGAYENRKAQYTTTYQQVYNELRDQGANPFDALAEAKRQANNAQEIGTLVGGMQGLVGTKMSMTPIVGTSFGVGYQKAIGDFLKKNGSELGKLVLEGAYGGGLAAAGEVTKNKMAQGAGIKRELTSGVADEFWGNVFMTAGIGLALKGANGISNINYKRVMNGLLKNVPEETIHSALNEKVQAGEITQAAADQAVQRINEYKEIDAQIPPNVTEEARFKIQDNIEKIDELQQQKESTHTSLQEPIKERIQKLTEDNLALAKEVDKPAKAETGLTKSKEKEAIELANEWLAEGIFPGTFEDAIKKDPIGVWREIAQQAQDRDANWKPLKSEDASLSEQAVRDQFGDTAVDYAKELFPAPEVQPTGASVIMPGDIKQRETITIKPQEHAATVEGSNEMDVRQQTSNGEGMGEGNAQPEGTPREEIEVPIEESSASGQEGVGEPPLPPDGAVSIHAERPATQLSFKGLQETANEFGFQDVKSRDQKSDLQTRVNAERTANEWASKGEYQANIDDMLGRIEKREMVPTDEQRLILEQYLENEKQKARDIVDKASSAYDRQLNKVRRIKEIGNVARSEAAAALRLPDGGSRPHPIRDETDAMVAKMEANKVDKLTDQQKAEVEARVDEYKKRTEIADAKVTQLEAQVASLDSQKEFNKTKSTTKRTRKTTEERVAYRRSEIEAARDALKKLRSGESGLSAVPLPGVRELMAIAPHVKNIMVDLVAQGIDNLQDVVKHLHGEFKDVLDGVTEKNIHDIIAGEYNEKSKPLTELQQQVRDIQHESKLINQLEAMMSGKEPKIEKAKIERNRKIKYLKDKIKDFRKEEVESNRFHGESDTGEKKLDALRDELERIQNRRSKEKPVKDSPEDKEISSREKDLRDKIGEAQAEWDAEKDASRKAKTDYKRLETERNRQLQRVSDIKEKISQLQQGIKAKGNVNAKKVDTPEIESLKKELANAEEKINKSIATEKRIKLLESELDRLEQRRDKEPKETEKREITDREQELKNKIEEERKIIRQEESEGNKFYKEELDEDAKKLIAIKKRNQKQEQEIKEKIANGKFEKGDKKSIFDREDVKKNYPKLRQDALDAIANKEEAQHEFDLALYKDEMAQRSRVAKLFGGLGKIIHTSKAVMSGIDDSATFVQNGLAMLANPKIGAKVWLNHWKDAFSDARFKRELSAIHQRSDWDEIKNSGLDIVEPHSAASKQVEEAFEQNLLAGKIKINSKEYQPWKYTGGIFERAFTSMGNNMRLALFEKQVANLKEDGKTFESHPQEYKDAARAINELTGRGQLPNKLAQASPYITPFIWAPRMLTSTINTLGLSDLFLSAAGKGYYQNLTPTQRKFALSQLGRGVAMGVGVMGAAALGGAKVDYDPRSVTFGDVIAGDHHYNVFGRYTPVIKALVQFSMGERIKKDGVQDLDSGKRGAKTRVGVVGGFFRGKATPFAGAMYDLAEGKNYFTNEPFTVKDLPKALLSPMSVKELIDGWKNDGTWTILNRFLPAFEGLKVSDERDFKETPSKSKSTLHKSPRGKQNKKLHNKNH